MSQASDVRTTVDALFARTLNVEVPAGDADLFESGMLDSLAFVELLVQLERTFGITTSMDDLELENFRTLSCIAEFVAARIGARESQWTGSLEARTG